MIFRPIFAPDNTNKLNNHVMKTITVKLSYYGNKDYGKRVYLITESPIHGKSDFVWAHDFDDWKKEMESDGYEIIVTE